jgi:hypothetical protein
MRRVRNPEGFGKALEARFGTRMATDLDVSLTAELKSTNASDGGLTLGGVEPAGIGKALEAAGSGPGGVGKALEARVRNPERVARRWARTAGQYV